MEQIDLFRKDLVTLGVNPVLEEDTLCLEYPIDSVDHKAVVRLINKYVGFWKSIGIKCNHSQTIARYEIPVAWIKGEDITEDQLLSIVGRMQQDL